MNIISESYKKIKEEFLKKKPAEKFDYIYEKLTDLEDDIESKECDCICYENSDWIEKIKFEQENNFKRLDSLDDDVYDLNERLEKIEKMFAKK